MDIAVQCLSENASWRNTYEEIEGCFSFSTGFL
jgi:hypothetical protein